MLNNEYPAPAANLRNLLIAVMFGLFIALFLLYFEPFDINVASGKDSVPSLFFFGFITASVIAVFLYLLPLVFPKIFSDTHWKVKHQIVLWFAILFVIATLNGIYTNYINSLPFSWSNYWWIISRTFVLGGLPFSFLILIDYQRKNLSYNKTAHYILDRRQKTDHGPKSVIWSIATDLKNDTITFDDQAFRYAVAVGNYIDLFTTEEGQLKRETYRVTLSSFEKQLEAAHLKRCHRSYLVNLNEVVNVSGNAQGLKLTLTEGVVIIPVSRKYVPIIKEFFSKRSMA
ncbi:MAG: LytTR family DNA-binding domain-containing protein [Cyclobacteriaceae bacterium]